MLVLLSRVGRAWLSLASLTAVFDVAPILGPFLPPFERTAANHADLFGKVGFLVGHHGLLLGGFLGEGIRGQSIGR